MDYLQGIAGELGVIEGLQVRAPACWSKAENGCMLLNLLSELLLRKCSATSAKLRLHIARGSRLP